MPNITYRHDLKQKSQQLRSNMTKEERHLWYDFLKTYCPQFRRQKPIGNYIADFYCSCCKLVVELDGGQHYEENGQVYDEKRTAYLSDMGITVLRAHLPQRGRLYVSAVVPFAPAPAVRSILLLR